MIANRNALAPKRLKVRVLRSRRLGHLRSAATPVEAGFTAWRNAIALQAAVGRVWMEACMGLWRQSAAAAKNVGTQPFDPR